MSVRVRAKRDDFLHEFVWLRDRADEVVFTYAKKNMRQRQQVAGLNQETQEPRSAERRRDMKEILDNKL